MSPKFLSLNRVMAIHSDQIRRYGGSLGIRDLGLLQSAIAQPRAMFDGNYLHVDLIDMASAYLFHLVQNHPFVDGNKRVGTAASQVFLEMNSIHFVIDDDPFIELVLQVSQGMCSKTEISEFFRRYIVE